MAKSSQRLDFPASLRQSLTLITAGGCLCMVFITGIESPATTEFFRAIGAQDIHFGLLSGIPTAMVFLQFLGAATANRLRRRKELFIWVLMLARILYIPVAILPLVLSDLSPGQVLTLLIAIVTLISAMGNFISPLWFTWMADLIPHRVLNTYWGDRQRWMYVSWTASYLGVTLYLYLVKAPITSAFPVLIAGAVAAGILDLSLFLWVEEPQNVTTHDEPMVDALLAPLIHPEYRTFVLYNCIQSGCIMFGAVFMQPYALKILRLPVWQTALLWCVSGIGNALSSRWWGRMADRHGHKPVLTLCIHLKPVVVLALFLAEGPSSLWFLFPVFFADGIWNAGLMVASNGYTMKIAPQRNRSMFVAAIYGFGGLFGGFGAVAGGLFLRSVDQFSASFAGRTWGHYHLLFLINLVMRGACARFVRSVREPESSKASRVLSDAFGEGPLRLLGFLSGPLRDLSERRKPAEDSPRSEDQDHSSET